MFFSFARTNKSILSYGENERAAKEKIERMKFINTITE